ncbi:MAG: glycosyltransferase [Ruminococcaceae bacterium]|nr:glycosyltransferase [Oscillospiraceae bacterium]
MKVNVLLSTYNGEKYLREQLDSILAQRDVDVYLNVADDCSVDSTADILAEYKEKHENFHYCVNEKNKNFTYNFIDLFWSVADSDFDYYAFSDQDDVWLPDKLIRAIEQISGAQDLPNGTLYCSNLFVADSQLTPKGLQENESIFKAGHRNFMFENIATGCTIVFDKKFKEHCLKYYPKNIILHDYWFFLIAAYTAQYIYDYNAYILYRQHESNQIGTNKKLMTAANVKKFFSYRGPQSHLISELIEGFRDDIDPAYQQSLIQVRDYKRKFRYKLKLLFSAKCHSFAKTCVLKLKILFNKL